MPKRQSDETFTPEEFLDLRKQTGLSQHEIAKWLHMSKRSIYDYERGATEVSFVVGLALCQELHIRDLESFIKETATTLAELERTFDLRWDADMRAIKRWQEGNPERKFTLPDHADLVVWLLERLAQYEGQSNSPTPAEEPPGAPAE